MPVIDNSRLDTLLACVHSENATDMHVTVGAQPMLRVHSHLKPIEGSEKVTPQDTAAIVEESLDEPHRQLLDSNGEVDFSFSRAGLGRFRANIFKQRGSYSVAIRSLPFAIPPFETLGLPVSVKELTKKQNGLILATGATGSGKSTTLASLINIINEERSCHIITIEDPIEYLHRHKQGIVNQREIGWDTKTFASALRAALREDPDVILVGEMRDPETIGIALTAAETGHLVLSTLHTIGAAKTIDRILDAFPPNQQNQVRSQLATVLQGVVSQQLLPRAEGNGLVLACEVMSTNAAIRNLIREAKSHQINSVIQTSTAAGMQTMDSSLAELCLQNTVTYEEALIRAQDVQTFQQFCKKRW